MLANTVTIRQLTIRPCFRFITVLCLILSASLASAEAPLTADVIERWLASTDAIQEWTEKNSEKLEQAADKNLNENPADMFSTEKMTTQLKASGLYDEAADLLAKYDFESPEAWIETQMRIFKAVMAVELADQKLDANAQAQLDQIKNNPGIPAEQKEMMINMIESSMKVMDAASKAPAADKAAVKPYIETIKKKVGESTEGR